MFRFNLLSVKTAFTLALLCFTQFTSLGQDQQKLDSLNQLLTTDVSEKERIEVYLNLSRVYKNIDTVMVHNYARKALEGSISIKYQKGIVDAWVVKGNIALEIAEFDRAGLLFQKAFDLAEKEDYLLGMSNALTNLGLVRWNTGAYDEALSMFNQSMDLLSQSEGPKNYVPLYNNIALLHYMKGDYDKAIANFEECIKIYEDQGNRSGLGRILVNTGVMHMEKGDYTTCLDYYFRALKIQKEFGQTNNMAANLNNIGATYRNQAIYDSAIWYFKESMELNLELGLKNRITENYNNLGGVHNDKGNYDSAEYYFNKALDLYTELNDLYNISLINRNIGDTYQNRGNYPVALEYYLESLKTATAIEAKAEIARTLNSIGVVYQAQDELDKALANYWQSNKISKAIDEQRLVASSYANIGIVHLNRRNYDSALIAHQHALAINETINNRYGVAANYIDLANVLKEKAQYDEANEYCNKSLEISQELGLQKLEALALLYKGDIAFQTQQVSQALTYLNAGTEIAKLTGNKPHELYGRTLLKTIYEAEGDYEKAYENQVLVASITDSIYNEASTKRLTRLEAEYEFEIEKDSIHFANEKEKMALAQKIDQQRTTQYITGLVLLFVIILLVLLYIMYRSRTRTNHKLQVLNESIVERNEEITQQRDQLNKYNHKLISINEAKNKILAVVAHDLRNPLQLIKGFVSLVKSKAANRLGEEENEFLDHALEASDRLSAMISELLDVSALESKKVDVRLERIDLKETLSQLAINFSFSARDKNQTIETSLKEDDLYINADKNYLIRVLENLISNALKFSEKHTNVKLSAFHHTDSILISVQDEGPGISESDQENLFQEFSQLSARSTGKEKSTGLGLSIVKKYVEAMGGMITCHSKLGEGTKFILDFKAGKTTEEI